MPRRARLDAPGTLHCQIVVKKLRYTGVSVARFLGVTTSVVNRMANERERNDLNEYLTSSL